MYSGRHNSQKAGYRLFGFDNTCKLTYTSDLTKLIDFEYYLPPMNMIKALMLASLVTCALFATGCGQTGPLYLPDDKPNEKTAEKSK